MKKETLQKRIEKRLYTKSGHLACKYEEVMDLLLHPEWVRRPVLWVDKGRTLRDHHANIEEGLRLLGIDFETGNDAPRGGKEGYFIKLTAKGKRQVKDFANGQ